MALKTRHFETPTPENLRRLLVLRYFVIAGQALALLAAHAAFDWALPLGPVGLILIAMALLNLFTQRHLQSAKLPTQRAVLGQLLADIAALTALLYFTGGAGNPMVSLYLLPVVVAATLLSSILTWLVAALTVLCYTVIFVYVPLPENHALHGGGFSLHLIGMWFTFLLSAALIAHFTARMARSLRARDAMLAAAREDALRSEQIVALGTMAAGAAHELGTPLNTMALLADELLDACCHDVQARQCVTELKTQIANCKQSITTLLAAAQHSRSEGGHAQPADEFLEDVFAKWQIIRPVAAVAYHWQGARPGPSILAEQTLGQAVINLLNNAADASHTEVQMIARLDKRGVLVDILDRGPGLSPHVQDRAGEPFFTTKPPGQGTGLGLFLANATIEKMGGSIELFSRGDGGTCTQVILPALTDN